MAVISLGFLVARFSIWLGELGVRIARRPVFGRGGASVAMGESMMAFGALLGVLAAWRYHVVNRDIEKGVVSADRWLIVAVTVLLVALTLAMAIYVAAASGAWSGGARTSAASGAAPATAVRGG